MAAIAAVGKFGSVNFNGKRDRNCPSRGHATRTWQNAAETAENQIKLHTQVAVASAGIARNQNQNQNHVQKQEEPNERENKKLRTDKLQVPPGKDNRKEGSTASDEKRK